MSRSLDDLDVRFKPLAMELIARCAEAGISVMVIDTLRTVEEQQANLAKGVSWTVNSKHLPQSPEGKSKAIDICPYEIFTSAAGGDKLLWDSGNPIWIRIGEVGEQIGLRWGGRWKVKDFGHFELRE